MNIFVCVKQVPVAQCDIDPDALNQSIENDELVWSINPEDECAVELAMQLREKMPEAAEDVSITVLRVGNEKDHEALIMAMAMGADDALLVEAPDDLDPYRTALALKGAIASTGKQPDLILCGTTAYDYDNHQVPSLLAMLLEIPGISGVVNCEKEGQELLVGRQVEAGITEVYRISTPVLLACSYGITVPRYAALPHMKRARQKPFVRLSLSEAGVCDADQRLRYFNYRLPPEKPQGRVFDASDDDNIADVISEVMALVHSEVKSF